MGPTERNFEAEMVEIFLVQCLYICSVAIFIIE